MGGCKNYELFSGRRRVINVVVSNYKLLFRLTFIHWRCWYGCGCCRGTKKTAALDSSAQYDIMRL